MEVSITTAKDISTTTKKTWFYESSAQETGAYRAGGASGDA